MKKIIITIIVIALAIGTFIYLYPKPVSKDKVEMKIYSNEVYDFSLKISEDFSVRESDYIEGGKSLTLENKNGDGIQILVSPYDDITELTQEIIIKEIPDMQISDPQVLLIGDTYKGLAFKSDNESFGGASREVWFVFKGNLYQISTYERMDELLKAIFSTWEFK